MLRVLHALLLGLVGAAIVHVTILFLLPHYSIHDAWTRLSAVTPLYATVRLDRETLGDAVPVPANPFIQAAVCRFDMADGILRVRGSGRVPFWSMSIYDEKGLNVFSISDRITGGQAPDLVVVTPERMLRMRQEVPPAFQESIFVEADTEEGILLFRVFVPDETWEGVTSAFLDQIRCEPERVG